MSKINFMNTTIDNLTMREALNEIDRLIKEKKFAYVVTPNVDHIVRLETNQELKNIYKDADLILADGTPLIWISKMYKKPIKEKVSGSDLFPMVCEMAALKGYKLFFLGAAEGVAEKAAEQLISKYPNLQISGIYSPEYGFENDDNEIEIIIKKIKKAKPQILIVGLGTPKQEEFIYKYRKILDVPISLGLGASFDFESGTVKRAPKWLSKCGLEWLYRLCKEPKRLFKRYLIDDIQIVKLIFKYWG